MKQPMRKPLNCSRVGGIGPNRGFTLIEIMVALLLGLLLSIGILSLFGNISQVNRTQSALAVLQENGRYAMTRIIDDLRSANGQYCSNSGGAAQSAATSPYAFQDTLRAPMVYFAALTLPDWGAPAAPTGWTANTPYPLTPRYFIQGYECPAGTCTPTIPPAAGLPAVGTNAGDRAAGADVLTVRGLHGDGTSIVSQANNANGFLGSATLAAAPTNFVAGDKILLADCSSARILKGTVGGTTFTPGGNYDDTQIPIVDVNSDGRVFNFSKDFRTATYYVGVQDGANDKVTSLMRRENGANGVAIVDGVERLDVTYGVEGFDGSTYFLKADAVDANTPGLTCPPAPPGFDNPPAALDAHCLWRAVKSIEVSLLLNTVDNLNVSAEEEKFRYSPASTTTWQTPSATLPSGLSKGHMLRREFRALVSVRNYLP